jgi:hypothetical protein
MVSTPHTPQLDVKSVWVEMLIRSQKQQSP